MMMKRGKEEEIAAVAEINPLKQGLKRIFYSGVSQYAICH
jgi:hypothetical protein